MMPWMRFARKNRLELMSALNLNKKTH